jgi:peptidoglycan-N-acetylglucosamine deacetylase
MIRPVPPSPRLSVVLASVLLASVVLPSLTPLQAQAPAKPGWQWSTDTIMRVVRAVRAGRSLQPKQWPGGARVAVALSFDVDNETVNLRFGQPTVGELSQGQYGARVGPPAPRAPARPARHPRVVLHSRRLAAHR